MILAIIESNSGGITSPSATPSVDTDPRPDRERQRLDGAGCRREARAAGSSAFRPGLDGIALGCRRIAFQPAPAGDVNLQLDQVEPGRQLGDRMLHLETGVDLEEREALLDRLVEELDRASVLVTGDRGETDGGGPQFTILVVGQRGATGLLDDLLVPPLHAAVADAGRPNGPVGVGDDLDLDVPGTGDDPLHEHRGVAERRESLGAGAGKRFGQSVLVIHPPDTTAAAARCGLDHQRIADRGRVPARASSTDSTGPPLHGATGTSDCSASTFAPILSPRRRMTSGRGPMNTTPSRSHSSANSGRSATKPHPTHAESAPRRHERPLQGGEVEIRTSGIGRPPIVDAHPLVGLADEHRRLFGPGVQSDRADVGAALVTQFPHRVDQAHRGLASIHDGNAAEPPIHRLQRM